MPGITSGTVKTVIPHTTVSIDSLPQMLSTYLLGVITLTSLCHCLEKVGASRQGLGGLRGVLGTWGFVPPVQRAQSYWTLM